MNRNNKQARGSLNRKLISLAVASCFVAGTAVANPTGPTVVSGQATMHQAGNVLSITNTPNAIINWQSFSIGAQEITRFNQQSALSAVLNRVTGAGGVIDPSVILGALQSNGRVFLLNPAGIVFGAGAQVDVAGLVASSLNLSNADFLAGRLNFTEVPGAGAVVNGGAINAGAGGQVYLVGPAVSNQGVITAPGGEVVLAAGQSVELVNPGTPNLRVEVVAPDNEARNLGEIAAAAGRIGIYAGLIDHGGASRADSAVATADGRIVLRATRDVTVGAGSVVSASGARGGEVTLESGGTTLVAGAVAATGSAGAGGTVKVLGERVGLIDQARVDASGATGGGTVLVGGSFQGKDPAVRNAQVTYFGPQASIDVSATGAGDGGLAVVWSEEATRAYGTIAARGGAQSGNGGLVEVSSRGWLDFHAKTDRRAPHGKAGTLLLDPNDVEVTSFSSGGFFSGGGSGGDPSIWESGSGSTSQLAWSDINFQLGFGDVIVTTSGPGTQNGDITILDPNSYSSSNLLQFAAHRNITVNSGATITNNSEGDLRLFAGWNGADPLSPTVQQGTGNISINANVTTKGNINFTAGNNIAVNGATVHVSNSSPSANRSLTFTAGNQISIASAVRVDLSGGESNHSATVNLNAGSGGISLGNSTVFARGQDGGFSGPGGAGTINLNTSGNVSAANSFLNAQGGYSDVDDGGPAAINFNVGGNILFDNSVAEAYGGSSNSGMGGSALIQLVANGNVDIVNGSSLYTSSFYGGMQGSGNSNVTVSSGGNLNVQNSFVGAEGGKGALARVQMAANGSVMIGGSDIEAYSFASNSAGNGTAADVSIIGGSVMISGSEVYTRGGDGSQNGGAATVNVSGTNGVSISDSWVGAFGGQGSQTGGGAAVNVAGASGVLVDQDSLLWAEGGFGSQTGGGAQINVTATAGEVRIDGAEGSAYGGYGSSVRGGDAAVTILGNTGVAITNFSIVEARGAQSNAAGGSASVLARSDGGSVTMRGHVEAAGAEGYVSGGSALVELTASGGDLLIEQSLPGTVVATGGYWYNSTNGTGTGGIGQINLKSTGAMTITGDDVYAYGGYGYLGAGDGVIKAEAGGSFTAADAYIVARGGWSEMTGASGGILIHAGGNLSSIRSHIAAIGGEGYNGNGGAGIAELAALGGNLLVDGTGSQLMVSTVEAIGGFSYGGGNGGLGQVSLISAGSTSIINDGVYAHGGYSDIATGGDGIVLAAAAGGFFTTDATVGAFGGFGEVQGGSATLAIAAPIITATHTGSSIPTTLVASGGSSTSASGLGAATALLTATGPTGTINLENERVDVSGGELSSPSGPLFGPGLIALVFPDRTTGGYFVNGVEGAITAPGSGSPSSGYGFFVNGQPAVPGVNFLVEYGGFESLPIFDAQLISSLTNLTETLSESVEVNGAEEQNGSPEDKKKKKAQQTCS